MTILFIILISAFMVYEMSNLIDSKPFIEAYDSIVDKEKEKTPKEMTKGCFYGVFHMAYFMFIIGGVALSEHWIIYLAFLLFSLLTSLVRRMISSMTAKIIHAKIDAIISLCFLFMMLMYQFNREIIDLLQIMTSWL